MKNLIYLVLGVSLIFSCVTQKEKPFNKNDSTVAYDAFNAAFYNPEKKLYYPDTRHDDNRVAAIWVQAIYWDMAMNAYKQTHNNKYKQLITNIYEGCYQQYDAYNWTNEKVWFIYDDMMWWVISLARGYELTHEKVYLNKSEEGFAHVWKNSYDTVHGGMFWNFIHDNKMACINYPTVIAATNLYNITKDTNYLNKAKEIYSWSHKAFFDSVTGRIADHRQDGKQPHWKMHVYNQGTCIGAAMLLYNVTQNRQYLDDAILAADYTRNIMSDKEGILPHEDGIEQGIYTAIFAQYITLLIEDGKQPQYLLWLYNNVNKGWENRDRTRNITYHDYNVACPSGVVESYQASGIPALMLCGI